MVKFFLGSEFASLGRYFRDASHLVRLLRLLLCTWRLFTLYYSFLSNFYATAICKATMHLIKRLAHDVI